VVRVLRELAVDAGRSLEQENVKRSDLHLSFQADIRYHGQGLRLAINVKLGELEKRGMSAISEPFDAEHKRLFTFALPLEHELVSLRAVVRGKGIKLTRPAIRRGSGNAKGALIGRQNTYMEGKDYNASVYERARLKAGNRIAGAAIVIEMDSTTVILPRHHGRVDKFGNILIYPDRLQPRSTTMKKAGAKGTLAKRAR
jgi:N-methylhydantoinase A